MVCLLLSGDSFVGVPICPHSSSCILNVSNFFICQMHLNGAVTKKKKIEAATALKQVTPVVWTGLHAVGFD